MNKVYTSAVVIIPPKELWSSIQDIREKYDRQIKRWMPHITLLYPFIPEKEFDFVTESFMNACEKISPFEIILNDFDFFHHSKQHYTIWIKPLPSKLIIDLQQSLLEVVPEFNDVNLYKSGFVPHLSLGQIIGNSKMMSILEKIRQSWRELHFLLKQIYFISRNPVKNSNFEIKKSFFLKK